MINQELIKLLHQHDIPCDDALLYLLSVYHQLNTDLIPEATIRAVNNLDIVERNYKLNTVEWSIPLYTGQNTDTVWEWVNDYRKLFANKNKEREGNKKACIQRMKHFFSQNPDVRKQDVMEATAMYMRTVEPAYVKMAEKFIYEGTTAMKTSMLESWCEKLFEIRINQKIDPNNKMMK